MFEPGTTLNRRVKQARRQGHPTPPRPCRPCPWRAPRRSRPRRRHTIDGPFALISFEKVSGRSLLGARSLATMAQPMPCAPVTCAILMGRDPGLLASANSDRAGITQSFVGLFGAQCCALWKTIISTVTLARGSTYLV